MVTQTYVKELRGQEKKTIVKTTFLIDSEVLRRPNGKAYCHSQDGKVKTKAVRLIESIPSKQIKIYLLVDYPRLNKSSQFTLNQAKYSCGFLLQTFTNFSGCFLAQDKSEIILYSREIEAIKQSQSYFCADSQLESSLICESLERHSTIFNYLRQFTSDITFVSDRSTDESLAANNSVSFSFGSHWLDVFDASKYG
ncbi:MAG: hypothetical protein QNJ38_01180 [Prochloraceae cyanobacterium]|nr:hypothetical protein [Prochloraceae cyanobacterium]